jgi:glutamine synthetase
VTNLLLAVDPVDEPITTFAELGINGGAEDLRMVPIDGAMWRLPWNSQASLAFGELELDEGVPCELAPRSVLARAEQRLADLGFDTLAAFEYEVRLSSIADGTPATPGRSYSIHGVERAMEFVSAFQSACAAMDLGLSAVHTEAGPGLIEINLDASSALEAADRAVLVRHALTEVAASLGMEVSLLAKPRAGEEGSSGHIHMSLWRDGANAMAADEGQELSPVLSQSVAGLLEHLSAASLCMNPTVNSYKRLVPGFFAPVNRSWGLDNRSTAVRAIVDCEPKMARIEVRRPGVDANPYLALASMLVSVALGLEQSLDPGPPASGDISESADIEALPGSLESAIAAFEADEAFRNALGAEFSDYFAVTRAWELRAWQRAVTSWELDRYGAP